MARKEQMSIGEVLLGTKGRVKVGTKTIAGGDESLNIVTPQAVEASAPTLSHKLKVTINGVEYWLGLDAV